MNNVEAAKRRLSLFSSSASRKDSKSIISSRTNIKTSFKSQRKGSLEGPQLSKHEFLNPKSTNRNKRLRKTMSTELRLKTQQRIDQAKILGFLSKHNISKSQFAYMLSKVPESPKSLKMMALLYPNKFRYF